MTKTALAAATPTEASAITSPERSRKKSIGSLTLPPARTTCGSGETQQRTHTKKHPIDSFYCGQKGKHHRSSLPNQVFHLAVSAQTRATLNFQPFPASPWSGERIGGKVLFIAAKNTTWPTKFYSAHKIYFFDVIPAIFYRQLAGRQGQQDPRQRLFQTGK
jgi:hypothetical protein